MVDTPRITTSGDIASMHGDRGGTIGSNSTNSRKSAAVSNVSGRSQLMPSGRGNGSATRTPIESSLSSASSRPPQSGRGQPPSPSHLSTYGSRAELGVRMHSMSALRAAAVPARKDDTLSSGDTRATGTAGSNQSGKASLLFNPPASLTEPSEMGEISPHKDKQFDTSLSPQEVKEEDIEEGVKEQVLPDNASQSSGIRLVTRPTKPRTPSPPPLPGSALEPAFPGQAALSPPPPRPWWKPS